MVIENSVSRIKCASAIFIFEYLFNRSKVTSKLVVTIKLVSGHY